VADRLGQTARIKERDSYRSIVELDLSLCGRGPCRKVNRCDDTKRQTWWTPRVLQTTFSLVGLLGDPVGARCRRCQMTESARDQMAHEGRSKLKRMRFADIFFRSTGMATPALVASGSTIAGSRVSSEDAPRGNKIRFRGITASHRSPGMGTYGGRKKRKTRFAPRPRPCL